MCFGLDTHIFLSTGSNQLLMYCPLLCPVNGQSDLWNSFWHWDLIDGWIYCSCSAISSIDDPMTDWLTEWLTMTWATAGWRRALLTWEDHLGVGWMAICCTYVLNFLCVDDRGHLKNPKWRSFGNFFLCAKRARTHQNMCWTQPPSWTLINTNSSWKWKFEIIFWGDWFA